MLIGKEALYAKRTYDDFKNLSYAIQTGNDSFNEKALREEINHYKKYVNNPVLGKLIDWSNFPLQSNDLKFIKDETLDFCKNQELKKAILKSVDLLKNSKYDDIKGIIDGALKAGADKMVA